MTGHAFSPFFTLVLKETTMGVLAQFDPPANQTDLANAAKDKTLREEWSRSIGRWTETAILGDPWTSLNDQNRSFYYNPLRTDIAGGTVAPPIAWFAFPNRILFSFPGASFEEQMGYAEGVHADGTFGPPPDINGQPYGPVGPRGWQDEYCEWIAVRTASGKITQIDFTCENPEYWFTLWRTDPQAVLSLYQKYISPLVKVDDLYVRDDSGQPVVDRATGNPAYNPTNRWNNQPAAGQSTGVVHLISPPNTLNAEIYLAAAATLLRDNPPGTPVTSEDKLIACSQYGTPHRNSDPHIGASVNNLVRGSGLKVSLQNPVGLYIQTPDFSTYELPDDPKLPAGAQPSDCWQILRGRAAMPGLTGNFILRARFALPQSWLDAGVSFTVGDITIGGKPIKFGAQITQTFQIALHGLGITNTAAPQAPLACVKSNPSPLPAPQSLQDLNLLQAGNRSSAVTRVEVGSTTANIALLAVAVQSGATVTFPEGGVTAAVAQFQDLPDGTTKLLLLTITVDAGAVVGDRSVLLTNPDGAAGPAAPGLLTVVPAGSLPHTVSLAEHVTRAARPELPPTVMRKSRR
jgi:hypothetical protein